MKKVLTICTMLVALSCLIVYAGSGITVVDRGNMETKAAAVTKADVTKVKVEEAPVTAVDEAKLEQIRENEAYYEMLAKDVVTDEDAGIRAKLLAEKQEATRFNRSLGNARPNTNLDDCTTPFPEDYETAVVPALPDCWTMIDADADGVKLWKSSSTGGHNAPQAAYISWMAPQVDDWLFSPGVALVGGTEYQLSFWQKAAGSYTEELTIMYGTAADVASMTNTIAATYTFSGTTWVKKTFLFTPATSGTYYIGWHATSADALGIYLDDFDLGLPPSAFACCYNDGADCMDVATEAECDALGGTWYDGVLCSEMECPVPCTPTQPDQYDAFTFTPAAGTAYLADLYDETGCLGYYDNGNDDIVAWHVTHGGWYEITLTSDDNYPGVAVTTDCEGTNCIVYATGGSAYTTTTVCTEFAPGDYFIFVGNWSETPTTFDLTAAVCTPPPLGRCCYGDQFAPSCDEMTEAACTALTDDISWVEGETCTSLPCEPAVPGRCCYGDPFAPSCAIETENDCLNRYNDIEWTEGITDCELDPCQPVECPPAEPVAFECVDAIALTVPATIAGSTVGSTPNNIGTCGTSGTLAPAVWYTVQGTGNTMTASLCDLCTDYDTRIQIWGCSCDALLCIGGDDDGCEAPVSTASVVSWCSVAGQDYFIMVYGYSTYEGFYILDVSDDGVACTGGIECPTLSACCYGDPYAPSCDDVTEAECDALHGVFYFGETCAEFECPTPCPFPSLDVEPNNDCTTAQEVACNNSYCGELTPSGDSDWYMLVITDPDCQDVTVSIYGDDTPGMWPEGQGLDPWVGFYSDDCTTLLFSDEDNYGPPGPSTYDCWIEATGCLEAGTYYIEVAHNYGSGGPYIMEIVCTPCECPTQMDCNDFVLCGTPVETEPNDDCLTNPDATVLECGTTMHGVICPFDEHDIFQVAVPAMTVVTISLFDGEGCTTIPTECVVNDLIAADCATYYGTGNTAGWTLTNDGAVAGFVYLDVYGTTDMCVSTYTIEVTCCDIVNGCSAEGLIPVEVFNGYYMNTGNTCCYTDLVPCVYGADCAGSCWTSGPDAVLQLQITETSLIDSILLTCASDCQMMIFTDCADPTGTCVASMDDEVGGNEQITNLTLDPGLYFLSVSYYGATGCGPYMVEIWSDYSLPVELVDFDAIASDRSVTLNWTTASESNNDRFEVFANGELRGRVDANNSAVGGEYSFTDANLTNGTTYDYSVVSVSLNGEIEELFTISATPSFSAATITEYALHQNFPNPFNPETKITFDLVDAGFVNLSVYNLLGQQVATLVNSSMDAGRHIVSFEANSLPSGLYLYRMETNGFTAQKKMVLLK